MAPSRELTLFRLLTVRLSLLLSVETKTTFLLARKLTHMLYSASNLVDVQVTGVGDLTKLNIPAGDEGGELGSFLFNFLAVPPNAFPKLRTDLLSFPLPRQILMVGPHL